VNGEKPQHLRAMEKANETRLFRAALLNEVKAGERWAAEVLFDKDPRLAKLPLFKLVDSVHRVGEKRAKRLLRSYYLHEQITLARLSPVTKRSLAESLTLMQLGRVHRIGRSKDVAA
jgi:hypothetical protein